MDDEVPFNINSHNFHLIYISGKWTIINSFDCYLPEVIYVNKKFGNKIAN